MAPKGKSPRKAAAAPAIEPGGDGDSWLGQQANQINIFNLFLTTTDDADFKQKLGERRTFTELGEDILCVNRTHELWAGFVGHTATSSPSRTRTTGPSSAARRPAQSLAASSTRSTCALLHQEHRRRR